MGTPLLMGAGKFGIPRGDIILNKSSINFGNAIVGVGVGGNFTVQATGLVGNLVITCSSSEFQVSDDGGSTLYTVLTLVPVGGAIPLTTIYAGYFPTGSGLDSGTIQVTNSNADTETINVTGTGVMISILYNEGFGANGGTPPYMNFPVGWVDPAGGTPGGGQWLAFEDSGTIPACNRPGSSGGTAMAFANGAAVTESSVSKAINTTGYNNISIEFNQYREPGCPAMTVEWSVNGVAWNNLGFSDVTDDSTWRNAGEYLLPGGANNQATLYFRFTVTGDAAGTLMAIDDLKIRGQS